MTRVPNLLGGQGRPSWTCRRPTRGIAAALCTVLLLAACTAVPRTRVADPARALVTLSIVGTNDLHGNVAPRDGRGGLALLGGYLANLRAARERDGGAVLLVDAGDMFQGTLESNPNEGAVVVAAYNVLGYAAAAVGNHEFDFGPVGPAVTPQGPGDDPRGALKARAAEARFPFLAANLIDERTGRPVDWPNVRPSVLVRRAGVTIGLVGVMTEVALSATTPANVVGLRVAPLAPTIAAEAAALRSAGAQVIVVAAHAGATCRAFDNPADLSSCDNGEIMQVARALPRALVDVIVAGHIHAYVAHEVEDVAIVAAFANGRAFGRVDLVVDRSSGAVLRREIHAPREVCGHVDAHTGACASASATEAVPPTYEGRPVVPSAAVERVLAPARAAAERLKAQPLGPHLDTPIRRLVRGDSPLGNLFTDALLHAMPGADVALHNTTGGLRADFPPGPLTYGHVYEVMPFDNRIVSIGLTGRELKTVVAHHLQRTSRILGLAGARVHVRCSGTGLEVVLRRPSGALVHDDERLEVVAGDFLATGGDGVLTPVLPPAGFAIGREGPLARDALAAYLRQLGDRLRESDFLEPAGPRIEHPGAPVVCG